MSESEVTKEFTLEEVQQHTSTSSCWLIIGNSSNGGPKVYDVTEYLDNHPGGAEVMLDVAGQDADEFFEDIGHSNEARKEMKKYLIGNFKLDEKTLAAMKEAAEKKKNAKSSGNMGLLMVVLIGVAAVLFRVYQSQTK